MYLAPSPCVRGSHGVRLGRQSLLEGGSLIRLYEIGTAAVRKSHSVNRWITHLLETGTRLTIEIKKYTSVERVKSGDNGKREEWDLHPALLKKCATKGHAEHLPFQLSPTRGPFN